MVVLLKHQLFLVHINSSYLICIYQTTLPCGHTVQPWLRVGLN